MQLIQIFLPLIEKETKDFARNLYTEIRKELMENFGGITTYTRSPATGLWKEESDKTVKDKIIIYEVMAEDLNRDWWKQYKQNLEEQFQQDEIIIRTWKIDVL
ncbi:MAG: hypothetical protein COW65_10010 [Cytophagales bacterium CG18_big_fil_WC_8_21_14_2_50_42_9]|nr:MAG: hypothetical protein COW65_10010 [Cytophagales bacterium CG18_big_fil_WC_8_21_14_2_50_42_9]